MPKPSRESATDPLPPISAIMPKGYQPPPGTPLTLQDFTVLPNNEGWSIQARAARLEPSTLFPNSSPSTVHEFVIDTGYHLSEDELNSIKEFSRDASRVGQYVMCHATADGETLFYRDPGTKRTHYAASLIDWVDFILQQDAQARLGIGEPNRTGDEFRAHRLSHKVVSQGTEEENLDNFENLAEFQRWLNRRLNGSPIKLTAFQVVSRLEDDDVEDISLRRGHYHPKVLPEPNPITTGTEKQTLAREENCVFNNYWDLGDGPWVTDQDKPPAPSIRVIADGTQIVGYCSDYVLPLSELRQRYELSTARDQKGKAVAPRTQQPDWWGLWVNDTNLAMVFPYDNWNLIVQSNCGGEAVDIDARPAYIREKQYWNAR